MTEVSRADVIAGPARVTSLRPPTHLRAVRRSINAIVLAWRAPLAGARPSRYEVLRDGKPIGRTTHRGFTDVHVRRGKRYRYSVRALRTRATGPVSRTLSVTVPRRDVNPPTAPRGVRAAVTAPLAVLVSWKPARDDVGVAAYDVLRNGVLVVSVAGRTYRHLDTGLASGTSYGYEVVARDAAGNAGRRSARVKVKTAPPGWLVPRTLTAAMVDRLWWRAGFGPLPAERQQWTGRLHSELVDFFLSAQQSYAPTIHPPTNGGRPLDPLADDNDLVMEWLDRMQRATNPLSERLTFFWHRHFAVSRDAGIAAEWLLAYRDRLARAGDLAKDPSASFRSLALAMTTDDGAMSYFLTSYQNVKGRPNENYAREFMELFCLGVRDAQGNANYTQTDVEELARAFTGWKLNFTPGSPQYGATSLSPSSFDGGTKTFLGRTGSFDATAAVDVVLAHPSHAPFLVTKLWKEFIVAPLPPATLDELVGLYTAGGKLTLAPVVRRILLDPLIFESLDEPNMIKPPVVFTVGVLRAMDVPMRDYWARRSLDAQQQLPYHPPNVAGWEGGLSWLNTSTVAARFDWLVACQNLKYQGAANNLPDPGAQTPAGSHGCPTARDSSCSPSRRRPRPPPSPSGASGSTRCERSCSAVPTPR